MNNQNVESIVAEEKREYFKQWRANNKDKIKKYNANYWRKRALTRGAATNNISEGEK